MLGLHLRQDAPFKDLEKYLCSKSNYRLPVSWVRNMENGTENTLKKQVCFALVFNVYFGVAILGSLFIIAKFNGEQKAVNIK